MIEDIAYTNSRNIVRVLVKLYLQPWEAKIKGTINTTSIDGKNVSYSLKFVEKRSYFKDRQTAF